MIAPEIFCSYWGPPAKTIDQRRLALLHLKNEKKLGSVQSRSALGASGQGRPGNVCRATACPRFSAAFHLFEGYRCLILRIAAPVFTSQPPVLRNSRKLLGGPCNRFESQSIFQ